MLEDRLKINGKLPRSRIVTASGCRCTTPETMLLYAKTVPGIGIFTTKSTGLKPNPGHHSPIYCAATDIGQKDRRNAVGLSNPGSEYTAEELRRLRSKSPDLEGVLLLGSVYGTKEEMVEVAKSLAPYVDCIESNFSCPNKKGVGIYGGWDSATIAEAVHAVAIATGKDVFAKLSPNLPDDEIARTAKACVDAGARGITVINTVGPGESYLPYAHGLRKIPVLFNRKGGLSGPSVLERGLQSVKIVRAAVGNVPLIIGIGGITSGGNARAYIEAGADFVGIGTAMEGMDSTRLADYVNSLHKDIEKGTDNAQKLVATVSLEYQPVTIDGIEKKSDDLRVFHFRESVEGMKPAQYVFLAVPGSETLPTMEAPFSVPIPNPLTLAVRRHPRKEREHHFTSRLWEHNKGDTLFVRGPYGMAFEFSPKEQIYLIGGGTGVAALMSIARNLDCYRMFMGAKTRKELLFIEQMNDLVKCSTDDGSAGEFTGFVTDMFEKYGDGKNVGIDKVVTCGPVQMMRKVVESANRKGFPDKDVYVILEPYMKCGVGICGSCSLPDGGVSCTDGHVITADRFKRFLAAGRMKRDETGGWEPL